MGQAWDGSFIGDYMLMLLETDRSHLGHIVTSQTDSTQTRTIYYHLRKVVLYVLFHYTNQ